MPFMTLPSDPTTGTLEIEDVIDDWDGQPVLFTCRNELGYKFLAIATSSQLGGDAYLYAPVSEERLLAIRTGLVSLRDAFSNAETESLLYVQDESPEGRTRVSRLSSGALTDDLLPAQGIFLDETLDTSVKFSVARLRQLVAQQRRPLIALKLETSPSTRRTEIALAKAGAVLTDFQMLAEEVALRDRPSVTGPVQFDVLREGELNLALTMAASFVFVIAPYAPPDSLFPLSSPTIDTVARVLDVANLDTDNLNEELGQFSKRTATRLRDFLTSLEAATSGVTLFNAAPDRDVETVSVSLGSVRSSLSVLRSRLTLPSERINIKAHLMAINHIRNSFGVTEVSATETRKWPRTFNGHFDSDLLPELDGLATGHSTSYSVTLLLERDVAEVGGATPRKRYRLISISPD